jgi:drug/metabolite transporter (DMT)-like permease
MNAKLKIILSMVLWGSLGIFVRYIPLPSLEIAYVRALIASVSIYIIKRIFINEKINLGKNKRLLLISGIMLSGNWILLFEAYKTTTIANATLSYYMAPIFAVILASFLVRGEKLTPKKLISTILAFIGLVIIINYSSGDVRLGQFTGIMFGLLAALNYAGVVICNKKMQGISAFDRVLAQMGVSALILTPIIIFRSQIVMIAPIGIISLIVIGLVHTTLAYLLYFPSLEHVSVHSASILSYIDPVSALGFGYVFLNEPLGFNHIIGGGLVLFGTYLSNKKK